MSLSLNPKKALIFRIVHRDNIPWILDHGLHCRNSTTFDPNYRNIGNVDLISKRLLRPVPIDPGGVLGDYIPFYFTPYSIMLFNIKTGWGGITKIPNEEIVILVSSLHELAKRGIRFLFTNQHAYPVIAEYYDDLNKLDQIDWKKFQNDPGKKERYQAEALVHRYLPIDALIGIGCYNGRVEENVKRDLEVRALKVQTVVKPTWYF
jgi:hypothetical protein